MIEEEISGEVDAENTSDITVGDGDDTISDEAQFCTERFNITCDGWDVDVEGLVGSMNSEVIHVLGFQRGFAWSKLEKSCFIESLSLGLPVPTLFLARDSEKDQKFKVIDGQQCLKTLQSYLNGDFQLSGSGIVDDPKGKYHSSRQNAGHNRPTLTYN